MKITSKTNKSELVAYAAQALGAQLDESKFSRDELIAEVRKLEKSLGIASDDAGDDDAVNESDTGNGNNAQNNDDADSKQDNDMIDDAWDAYAFIHHHQLILMKMPKKKHTVLWALTVKTTKFNTT